MHVGRPTRTEGEHREGADAWPAGFAGLGFAVALLVAALFAAVVAGVASALGATDGQGTGATLVATLLQDAAFVGAAVWLATLVGRPRAADFGLRAAPLRRAIAWTVGAGAAFYAFMAVYSALLGAEGEQDTLDSLGVDEGTALLVAGGLLVIVVAPFAEELLFRGFMYRSLRNRYSVVVSTLIIGVIFGAIHYDGADTVELLPVLAVLGAVFCILYERTGSLYPAIALHAVNNAIAFAVTADASGAQVVAGGALVIALALCLVLPAVRRGGGPVVQVPPI